ncbi:tRNA U34 5-methylaminomethyl-2-thiouridine-forming methyltransferase MnmC [Mucilaginibacter yixingensis]|uniref:tRNA U34 5-methylaminomethyl-2-thiouridine-forming methyltransferase MnmC n=2 Tax=Mucilaginibacter yixingensis TaxID=1295612 RepID=A0A2T5J7D0_9SPHI|nr:tRNA U34 5-methylaminomethyl-2-thiouridine-forming methyltransferase MnmC [Mucilaginibacter yixingensis]
MQQQEQSIFMFPEPGVNGHFAVTGDGSKTIYNPQVGENYHSRHGALQESNHVFLNSGLRYFLAGNDTNEVSVLEVGLGTALNFLLSADYCTAKEISLNYTGIEAHPLNGATMAATGYDEYVSAGLWNTFLDKYPQSINQTISINNYCQLQTAYGKLMDFSSAQQFDVIYFDAFAAIHQPEMWDDAAITHTINFLKPGGVFVTYAITGHLKRLLKSLGLKVEKAPGAPGKREMLRAVL